MLFSSKAQVPTIAGLGHRFPDSGEFCDAPNGTLILARIDRLPVVREIEEVPNP